MPVKTEIIALALGSNIGDRMATLKAAVSHLKSFVSIKATSPVYETAAAYVTDQPAFLNAALLGTTELKPIELLHRLKDLEQELGRTQTFRNGPRMIDIDILFYGNRILDAPELTLPHSRIGEREFVLRPLADIAPGMKHPVTNTTIAEMLAHVPTSHPEKVGML